MNRDVHGSSGRVCGDRPVEFGKAVFPPIHVSASQPGIPVAQGDDPVVKAGGAHKEIVRPANALQEAWERTRRWGPVIGPVQEVFLPLIRKARLARIQKLDWPDQRV